MRWALPLVLALVLAGCSVPPPAPGTPTPTASTPATTPTSQPPYEPRFDGGKALDLVREQVLYPNGSVRTRVPGTEGNAEVARWIDAEMSALGYEVRWHHFNASYGCQPVPMHNVVAERNGTSGRAVVFAAHYDTRPVADKDPDAANRASPIPGANDGASGVAVLLELARVLPATNDTVRFLFFDGEDGGGYRQAEGCRTDWILGSTAYAAQMPPNETAAIDALVLVDMVGDADLRLPKESYTAQGPGAEAQDAIYATAKRLGHEQFLDEPGLSILDDHTPFLDRGVPAVDLIHTTDDGHAFPDWHHTLSDDVDAVSPVSLDAVGETLEAWFATRG